MIDLHFHSYYSDGIYSPKELVNKAVGFGFKILSLTDHDTVAGIEEAKVETQRLGVKLIPGIELYSNYQGRHLHLLGYKFDFKNKKLLSVLGEVQKKHRKDVQICGQKLEKMGFTIDMEKIFAGPSKYVGLGHFVNLLRIGKNWEKVKKEMKIKEGEIITLPQITSFYFYPKEGPLLPEAELPASQAIALIKEAGGIAVLAHPGQHFSWHRDEKIIFALKKIGLEGLEAISSHHDWANMVEWQRIAKKYDLFVTCGSDLHGDLPEEWRFPLSSLRQYFKIADNKLIKANLKPIIGE